MRQRECVDDPATEQAAPLEERLAIAGGGAIACGLAVLAARQAEVCLWVRSPAAADRAERRLSRLREREQQPLAPIHVTTDWPALADGSFVVEAIAEDLAAKRALLGQLHELLDDDAIVATTTSSLSIAALAAASERQARFVGLHLFNPVTKMALVELVLPAQVIPATRERALAFCRALGKTAVTVPDLPGFVVNRLLFPFLFSAVELLDQTELEPAAIDACMTLGAGHPMGPLALLDFIGLDVAIAIGEQLEIAVPERIRALVGSGALGRKSGRGLCSGN